MQIESRHYDALFASALCASGAFVLCGKTLVPFSFRHQLQLEALDCPLWSDSTRKPDGTDYLLAAAICSQRDFLTALPVITRDTLLTFDPELSVATWREYVRVCHVSHPRLWKPPGSGGGDLKAPFEEVVITYILRHAHGYTREQLWTMCAAEVMWIFEAIREQLCDRSRIITDAEHAQMQADSAPAALAATAKRERIAGQIFRALGHNPKLRLQLLQQLDTGKLPRDWRKKLPKKGARSAR